MMTYNTRQPSLTGVRGTHYNGASQRFYYADDQGKVYVLPTGPAALLVQKSQGLAKLASLDLNAAGSVDIKWTGTVLNALSGALIVPLANVTSLDSISITTLTDPALWAGGSSSVPQSATSTNYYLVKIPFGAESHYVKMKISPKTLTMIQVAWETYSVSPNPVAVGSGVHSNVRDIVVSDAESGLYYTAVDPDVGGGVFGIDRTGTLFDSYPLFNGSPLINRQFNSVAFDNPQQMVLDGATMYVADSSNLWRVDFDGNTESLVQGTVAGVEFVGVLLSNEGGILKAYLSDSQGNVFVVDLSAYNGSALPLPPISYSLGGASGFMNWGNEDRTVIYATVRSTRQVVRLDLKTGNVSADGTTSLSGQIPWSAEAITDNKLFVSCELEIGQFDRTIMASDILLLGIGLVPFDYITNSSNTSGTPNQDDGKADTSGNPNYYFSGYPNLPFGGNLSLMLNHDKAWNTGIRFYSIRLKNLSTNLTRAIVSSFADYKWEELANPPRFMPATTSPTNGLFPIRDPEELWYNHWLAALVVTNFDDNGHNVLSVDFFDANKQLVANGHFERLIYIDNTRCNASLQYPRLGTDQTSPAANDYPSLVCGCLAYETKNDLVEVDFTAWQPQGSGTYSLSFSRGVPGLSENGTVTMASTLLTKKTVAPTKPIRVGHIIGDCDVANVVISLSVPSRVIDGMGWVNLGATTSRSFTVIRGPLTHTAWTSPD